MLPSMIARHGTRSGSGTVDFVSPQREAKTMVSSRNKPKRRNPSFWSPLAVVLACFLSSAISFYAGVFVGMQMGTNGQSMGANFRRRASTSNNDARWENLDLSKEGLQTASKPDIISTQTTKSQDKTNINKNKNKNDRQQPKTTSPPLRSKEATIRQRKLDYVEKNYKKEQVFLPALEYVDRDDFVRTFESLGVPFDSSEPRYNDRVMILYAQTSSYPDPQSILESNSTYFQNDEGILDPEHPHRKKGVVLSVDEATKNCNNLHIVLTDNQRPHQCIAILGQYESFNVHKFMRASPEPKANSKNTFDMDPSYPLRPVNRGMKTEGGRSIFIPNDNHFRTNWNSLSTYLQNLEGILEQLAPVAKSVAQHNKHNTIVIMVCNFGQSELLMNFVCNARARGLGDELSNILVFSTDKETHELATSVLGLTSFYSEEIFGAMPKEAAGEYGDNVFRTMMFAKVYCVHIISMLGHDILFQDVDVIWYKNPLDFFHNDLESTNTDRSSSSNHPAVLKNYDMIFQDDGNRGPYYAPYSANTGFYYVKNNPQTKAFFNSLLLSGDLILSTASHQIALIQLLNEHAGLYGLRTKVWDRNTPEFPGGHFFHSRRDSMKKIAKGELVPYIFHMSWTNDKSDKVKYMQQMGLWHLKDTCRNKSMMELKTSDIGKNGNLGNECCSIEPLIQCYYRDKPSIHPCPDAPFIDKDGKSFW